MPSRVCSPVTRISRSAAPNTILEQGRICGLDDLGMVGPGFPEVGSPRCFQISNTSRQSLRVLREFSRGVRSVGRRSDGISVRVVGIHAHLVILWIRAAQNEFDELGDKL